MQFPALPDNEAQRLRKLRAMGLLDTEAEEVLDAFTRMAASITGMPIALISLLDADRQWFKSAVGLPQGAQTSRDLSFCGHVVAQGHDGLFEVPDALADPRFHDNPLVTGPPHVVHYAGAPLTMPGGERIGTLCVIDDKPGKLSDIHREFLTHAAQSVVRVLLLRESDRAYRDRMHRALHAGELGFWDYDPVHDGLWVSDEWAALFCPALKGRTVPVGYLRELSSPETVAAFQGALVRLLKGQDARMSLKHEVRGPDGNLLWIRTEAEVVERDPAGRALRVVGTSKHVTQQHHQEQQLVAALAKAEQAVRAKSAFASTLSHEVRTPINGVIGLTRMLAQRNLPGQDGEYVRMIGSCADSLLALVNGVLDFAKIEAGEVQLERLETDLLHLLHQMQDVFALRAQQKGLEFRLEIQPHLPARVVVDPTRLRQVLLNLCGNALKFTSSGCITVRAAAGQGADGQQRLVFSVEDTGSGIAPEALPHLFRRFSQADVTVCRTHGGTGLGLAISRELARLMGGDIDVRSRLGEGSTFTFSAAYELAAGAAPGLRHQAPAADWSAARILLVEDNEINRLVAASLLGKLGITRLQEAQDGREAVEAFHAGAFDLVLMDCQMPVMDGYEAARVLVESGCRTPIVALTASVGPDEQRRCREAGMCGFVAKPVQLHELRAALAEWLHPQGSEAPAATQLA